MQAKKNGFLKSSLGNKYLMAITGVLLYGFVMTHLLGNLLVFAGRDAINTYGQGLANLPFGLLWLLRFGLLLVFVIHVRTAFCLNQRNRSARPVGYARFQNLQLSFASRYMIHTGIVILAFIAFHICHYTFAIVPGTNVNVDALGRKDIYQMVLDGFQQPVVSITYVVAMIALGVHLQHGLKSLFQSLGLHHKMLNGFLKCFAPLLGWMVAGGNIFIVIAIWFGLIGV